MSTEKLSEEIINFNLINKKRAKMRFSKNKKRHKEIPGSNNILITSIIKNRDMKLAKDNIRHFFHINWDDKIFCHESIKIGEYMNDNIYWFLINCSYFNEEDIQEYINILKEEYLNTISFDKKSKLNIYNSYINLNAYNIYDIGKLNDQFYNCLNKYDYNYSVTNIDELEKKIKIHLNLINNINRNNINKLEQKAKEIKEQLDNNNNIINENENIYNCFQENEIYTKNKLSSSIRSKFLTYLFNKEKENLMKKIRNKIIGVKDDDDEEKKYMNICSICNNCYMYQYEMIFQCIQCGLKVHSSCYGIKPRVNPKKWKCEICKEISNEESINLECILCPNKLGGLKKVHIPKNSGLYQNLISQRKSILEINNNHKSKKERFKQNDSEWVHLTCAQWNKSIKFSISSSQKNISIIEMNNFEKLNHKCDICNKDFYGPTVKCANNNCTFYCHPECARINDYYMEIEKDNLNKNLKYSLYCHNHFPNKYVKLRDYIAKNKVEDVFLFDEALNRVFEKYETHYNHKFYYKKNDSTELSNNLNIINLDDTSEKKIIKNKEKKKKEKKYLNNVNNISIFNIYSNENNYINNQIFGMEQIHEENNINLINKRNITNNIIINYNNNINPVSENEKFIKLPEQYNEMYSDSSSQKSNYNNTYINNNYNINSNNITEYNTCKIINNNPIESNYSNNSIIENNNNSFIEKNCLNENLITPIDPLEKEIEQNKESFIVYIIGFFYDYYKKNRIILMKGNGDYSFPESDEEEDNSIYDMSYEDLFSKYTPINEIHYKDLTINLTKKYLSHIFPDEKAFKELFLEQIDSVMEKLKKNERFKNKEIFCISQYKCKGSENGKFKLLSIPQFKYQILVEKQIPSTFICDACLENIELKQDNLFSN